MRTNEKLITIRIMKEVKFYNKFTRDFKGMFSSIDSNTNTM